MTITLYEGEQQRRQNVTRAQQTGARALASLAAEPADEKRPAQAAQKESAEEDQRGCRARCAGLRDQRAADRREPQDRRRRRHREQHAAQKPAPCRLMRRSRVAFAGNSLRRGREHRFTRHFPGEKQEDRRAADPYDPAHRFELQQRGHARERERRVNEIADARAEAEPEARPKAVRQRQRNDRDVDETDIEAQRQGQKKAVRHH
ncbi:hypothetical protein OKW28_006388 [Paraburkholderia sp. 40]